MYQPRRSLRGRLTARAGTGHGPYRIGVAFLLSLFVLLAAAPGVAAEDVYSEETLRIARKLQCPVCAGQSVADSNSQLARQMRDIIERKVQAGESEEEIIAYFAARYGDWIVTEPAKSGFSLGLWWMPVVVVLLGFVVVGLYVRERTRRTTGARANGMDRDDEELEALAREILGPASGERTTGA